jgi:hypothetical protein
MDVRVQESGDPYGNHQNVLSIRNVTIISFYKNRHTPDYTPNYLSGFKPVLALYGRIASFAFFVTSSKVTRLSNFADSVVVNKERSDS